MPTRFDGADISHHQDDAGPIDWPTLRSVSWWCATKATQGLAYRDPTFTDHRQQMAAQGFTHRLFYGWLSPRVDPVAQAKFYLSVIGQLSAGSGCMIDAEEGGITAADVLDWCETVEAVTHRPVAVYTGAYVAGGTIWQSTAIRNSDYGPRPMHLAAYTTEAKAKKLPGVAAYPWSAWQYSSNGPVPGVVGRCDMNRIDIVEHFDLACGVTPDPLPPQEDDVKIATNKEDRANQFGGIEPAGTMIFVVDVLKRNIGAEEYKELYANGAAKPLSNATLDAIPDYAPTVEAVDQVARDGADHANEAVTRIGTTISDIRIGGQRIADAGGQ